MLNDLSVERGQALDHQIRPLTVGSVVSTERRGYLDRLDRAIVKRFQCKEHIFCEGDPRTHVFQIEDGVVTIYQMLNDGRRQIVDFAYAGDFIGLGTTGEHLFTAPKQHRRREFEVSAPRRWKKPPAAIRASPSSSTKLCR